MFITQNLSHTIPKSKNKINVQTNAKGGVAAWSDVPKQGNTLGNLTPADRHGSVQVRKSFLSLETEKIKQKENPEKMI